MRETSQRLDWGERWLRDGLAESVHAGGIEAIDVDVTEAAQLLQQLKADGTAIT